MRSRSRWLLRPEYMMLCTLGYIAMWPVGELSQMRVEPLFTILDILTVVVRSPPKPTGPCDGCIFMLRPLYKVSALDFMRAPRT